MKIVVSEEKIAAVLVVLRKAGAEAMLLERTGNGWRIELFAPRGENVRAEVEAAGGNVL